MRTVIVIPARAGSSRFHGKPLAWLTGATGIKKTLIQRTWEAAMGASKGIEVYVATDHEAIMDTVRDFGGVPIMTGYHNNGTERCAEVANKLGLEETDIVINLQGDSPLVTADALVQLVELVRISGNTSTLVQWRPHIMPGAVSVAVRRDGGAMYFSRSRIPMGEGVLAHIGVYGFPAYVLRQYARNPVGRHEAMEQLEQLRFLEHGWKVECLELKDERHFREVNYPEDISLVEAELVRYGVA